MGRVGGALALLLLSLACCSAYELLNLRRCDAQAMQRADRRPNVASPSDAFLARHGAQAPIGPRRPGAATMRNAAIRSCCRCRSRPSAAEVQTCIPARCVLTCRDWSPTFCYVNGINRAPCTAQPWCVAASLGAAHSQLAQLCVRNSPATWHRSHRLTLLYAALACFPLPCIPAGPHLLSAAWLRSTWSTRMPRAAPRCPTTPAPSLTFRES